MQRLCTKAIATMILLGACGVATTASADMNYGPAKSGDQCFNKSGGGSESMFGWWGPCPQPAATELQRQPSQRENRARRR